MKEVYMKKKELNRAVIGCGVIANEMAQGFEKMGRTLYSVANRTHEKAVDFAKKYNVRKVYDAIDEVFADPDVEIIYITTPHNTHYKYMKAASLERCRYLQDMEEAVHTGDTSLLHLQESCEVMNIMTKLCKDRGVKYPGEIW